MFIQAGVRQLNIKFLSLTFVDIKLTCMYRCKLTMSCTFITFGNVVPSFMSNVLMIKPTVCELSDREVVTCSIGLSQVM